jgi:DNA-binding response OmpR family regulator
MSLTPNALRRAQSNIKPRDFRTNPLTYSPTTLPAGVLLASPARPRVLLRFGPFELNAASGELRKAGIPLKIHPQPLRVLQLLAERSGQVVRREEIQRCLWGDNTYVDFEAGINFCIKQVRDTLADDAENPATSRPFLAAAIASLPP